VTSAHCVLDKNSNEKRRPESSTFHIGRHDLINAREVGYKTSYVQEFFIHPDWDSISASYKGDVAVATLVTSVEFSDYIRPICIWQQSQTHYDVVGKSGLVAGN
jgi:hypothetical protein